MDFLGASFLWGLPLIAVPVLIHLLNRRRREVVRWGAMQFLLEAAARRRRRWRLEDLLLMLLRAAAVAAIVLALAQPRIKARWVGATGPRDVIVVVDNSLSTARLAGQGVVLDAVVDRTDQVLSELSESDYVRILLASQPPEWLRVGAIRVTAAGRQQLGAKLKELKPTLAAADMTQCVRQAIEAEAADPYAVRVVTVVTDGQAYGWRLDGAGTWRSLEQQAQSARATLHVVTVGEGEADVLNLAIDRLATARTAIGRGERSVVTATVRNTGDRSTSPATVRLFEGDQELATVPLAGLSAGQTTTVNFEPVIDVPGVHLLRATIVLPDDLPLDNEGQLAIEIVEEVPILLVESVHEAQPLLSDAGYLAAALGPNGRDRAPLTALRPRVITPDELDAKALQNVKCVILADVRDLSAGAIKAIEDAVREGLGLWLVLGRRADSGFFNSALFAGGQGLSPLPLGDAVGDPNNSEQFERIPPPSPNHPATRCLADTQRLDIDRAKVYRRHRLVSTTSGQQAPRDVTVLLTTDRGETLAAEKPFGRGRVIVQSIPMDVNWSNLPLCQAFVVMVHEWLWYLAEPRQTQWNVESGESVTFSLPAADREESAEVKTPPGARLTVGSTEVGNTRAFTFAKTLWPGAYEFILNGPGGRSRKLSCVVRRDSQESDLTRLSAADCRALTEAGGLEFGELGSAVAATTVAGVAPRPMWSHLLIAILCVMVAEVLLSQRLTRRRYGGNEGLALTAGG